MIDLNSLRIVEYATALLAFRSLFLDVNALKIKLWELEFSFILLQYNSNDFTEQKGDFYLARHNQCPCLYTSVLLFSIKIMAWVVKNFKSDLLKFWHSENLKKPEKETIKIVINLKAFKQLFLTDKVFMNRCLGKLIARYRMKIFYCHDGGLYYWQRFSLLYTSDYKQHNILFSQNALHQLIHCLK